MRGPVRFPPFLPLLLLPLFALPVFQGCGSSPWGDGGRPGPRAAAQEADDERFRLLEHRTWERDGEQWAAVTLTDASGAFVTGRALSDFSITETLIRDGAELATRTVAFDEPLYQFDGPGFWERAVTGRKLDVVFIVDTSGTMEEELPDIASQLHAFVDRLQAGRIDFQVAVVADFQHPEYFDPTPFFGPMEVDELRTAIDNVAAGYWGEGWIPNTGYDSILWALDRLPWRQEPDVERLLVLITDTYPQSVYGNFWGLSNTPSNAEGPRLALEAAGVAFYYSQPADPAEFGYTEDYADPDRNPGAACTAAADGLDCGFARLGTRIAWPFRQEDLPLPDPGPLADARYYFAWLSPFSGVYSRDPWAEPGDRIRVEIRTADPDDAGAEVSLAFTYTWPGDDDLGTIRLVLTDEAGDPVPHDLDWGVKAYAVVGDRAAELTEVIPDPDLGPGVAEIDLMVPGRYVLATGYDLGSDPEPGAGANPVTGYEYLYLQGVREVEVSAGQTVEIDWQLRSGDRSADLFRARGLVADLRGWGLGRRPFAAAADRIEAWLDELEAGPMTWDDQDRLRRLTVALGGYLNAMGFAETQTRAVEQGLVDVLQRLRHILAVVTDTAEESRLVAGLSILEAAARLDALSADESSALEALAETLKEYAQEELVPDLLDEIADLLSDAFPGSAVRDYAELFLQTVVLQDLDSATALADALRALTLDQVLDTALGLAPTLLDPLWDQILDELPDPAREALVLVRELVERLAEDGLDGLDAAIEDAAKELRDTYLSREAALARMDEAFGAMQAALPVGPVRDALVPLVQELLRAALRDDAFDFDTDAAIAVLASLFVREVVLKPGFNDPVADQLDALLDAARAFEPDPALDQYGREAAMEDAFEHLRVAYWIDDSPPPGGAGWEGVGAISHEAWGTLGLLDPLDDISQAVSVVQEIAGYAMQGLAYGLCGKLYPTCFLSDDLENLTLVLDAVGLFTRTMEMGLRIDDLLEMRDDLSPAVQAAFF